MTFKEKIQLKLKSIYATMLTNKYFPLTVIDSKKVQKTFTTEKPFPNSESKHLLIEGDPDTGKSSLLQDIAKKWNIKSFYYVFYIDLNLFENDWQEEYDLIELEQYPLECFIDYFFKKHTTNDNIQINLVDLINEWNEIQQNSKILFLIDNYHKKIEIPIKTHLHVPLQKIIDLLFVDSYVIATSTLTSKFFKTVFDTQLKLVGFNPAAASQYIGYNNQNTIYSISEETLVDESDYSITVFPRDKVMPPSNKLIYIKRLAITKEFLKPGELLKLLSNELYLANTNQIIAMESYVITHRKLPKFPSALDINLNIATEILQQTILTLNAQHLPIDNDFKFGEYFIESFRFSIARIISNNLYKTNYQSFITEISSELIKRQLIFIEEGRVSFNLEIIFIEDYLSNLFSDLHIPKETLNKSSTEDALNNTAIVTTPASTEASTICVICHFTAVDNNPLVSKLSLLKEASKLNKLNDFIALGADVDLAHSIIEAADQYGPEYIIKILFTGIHYNPDILTTINNIENIIGQKELFQINFYKYTSKLSEITINILESLNAHLNNLAILIAENSPFKTRALFEIEYLFNLIADCRNEYTPLPPAPHPDFEQYFEPSGNGNNKSIGTIGDYTT